jgi:hypothetical protein
MVISEFLRPQEGVEEIDCGCGADDQHDERLSVHEVPLLHAVAEMNVGDRSSEKCEGDGDPKNVLHEQAPCFRAMCQRPFQRAIRRFASALLLLTRILMSFPRVPGGFHFAICVF